MSEDANATAIIETVRQWTDGQGDASPLLSIADRESRFHHLATGDESIAPGVFDRVRNKLRDSGNPWTDEPSLWGGSFGLFQLMAPYYVQKWAVDAHPWALYHPIAATVVAGRLWNRAIQQGAQTPVDVRMVWAFGPDGLDIEHDDERYTERVTSERARWKKLGIPGDPANVDASRYHLTNFGIGPQVGQVARLGRIAQSLGISQNPFSPPPEEWIVKPANSSTPNGQTLSNRSGGGVALGILFFVGIGLAALGTTKGKRR